MTYRIPDRLDDIALREAYESWEGGLNNRDLPGFIGKPNLSVSNNCIIDERGRLKKMDGLITIADDLGANSCLSLGRATFSDSTDWILSMFGTTLYRYSDGDASWTSLDSGFTTGLPTKFVQAKDLVFVLNGTDNVHSLDSSGTVTDEGNGSTDPVRSKTGVWAKNYLFLLNDDDDVLYFSNLNDPQTFTRATDLFRVGNLDEHGRLKAGLRYKVETVENVVIFKERAIYLLDISGATPTADWKLSLIDGNYGTLSPESVRQVGNDIFFVDQYGDVRSLIRTEFDKLNTRPQSFVVKGSLDDLNHSQLSKIAAYYFKDKYFLWFPTDSSTYNNAGLIWSEVTKSWSCDQTGVNVAAATTYPFSGKLELVVGEASGDSLVYKALKGTSLNGSAIDFDVQGRRENFGTDNEKIFDTLTVEAETLGNYDLTIQGEINDSGFTTLGTLNTKGGAPTLPVTLPFDLVESGLARADFWLGSLGPGRTFRWRIRNNAADEPVTITSVVLTARLTAYRRT